MSRQRRVSRLIDKWGEEPIGSWIPEEAQEVDNNSSLIDTEIRNRTRVKGEKEVLVSCKGWPPSSIPGSGHPSSNALNHHPSTEDEPTPIGYQCHPPKPCARSGREANLELKNDSAYPALSSVCSTGLALFGLAAAVEAGSLAAPPLHSTTSPRSSGRVALLPTTARSASRRAASSRSSVCRSLSGAQCKFDE